MTDAAVAEHGPPLWDSSRTLSIREAQLVAGAVRILLRLPKGNGGEIVSRLYGEAVLHEALTECPADV
jgi:hypothetical protein